MFGCFSKKPKEGPDFSHLDSKAKVDTAYRSWELEPLYLMPPELGGDENPLNVVYVPVGVAEHKRHIDVNVIGATLEDGSVSRYRASPAYQGDSHVPNAIEVRAWDPDDFSATISIWGDALAED